MVSEEDQVMAIMTSGKVIRANVNEVKRTGRTTQGVTFAKPEKNDEIISIARNAEAEDEADGETTTTESSGSASSIQTAQGEPVFEVSTENPSGMPLVTETSEAIERSEERGCEASVEA